MSDPWNVFKGMINSVPRAAPQLVKAPEDLGPRQAFVPADSQLNFEQRVLRPSQYPTLAQEGEGNFATHKMAYAGTEKGFMAYPTVVQMPGAKELQELEGQAAMDYALKSGEFRQFADEQSAADYARGGYKQQWGSGEPPASRQPIYDALSRFNRGQQ